MERDDGDQLALATVDPVNRELGHYFQAAMAPKTQDPAQITAWLEKLLTWLMTERKSAAVDFGGGDTSLGRLVAEVPDLQTVMEDAGVEPVALYLLSPRSTDLTPLAAMEQTGFKPKATALILNEGRADSTRDRDQEFAQLRKHSTYRAAISRGAVEIWMPRLYAAKAIEDRRLLFHQAMTGETPERPRRPRAWRIDRSEPDTGLRHGRCVCAYRQLVTMSVTVSSAQTSMAPEVGARSVSSRRSRNQ